MLITTNQKGKTMAKEEALRILILLSQMEGFLLGKLGNNTMPESMTDELIKVCHILAKKVSE